MTDDTDHRSTPATSTPGAAAPALGGVPGGPTLQVRIGWARTALRAYRSRSGQRAGALEAGGAAGCPHTETAREELAELCADLIADILHLAAPYGLHPSEISGQAWRYFGVERTAAAPEPSLAARR